MVQIEPKYFIMYACIIMCTCVVIIMQLFGIAEPKSKGV